ncbi:hypothetical protein ABPG75_005036 [Micractinium tetrahymenae]
MRAAVVSSRLCSLRPPQAAAASPARRSRLVLLPLQQRRVQHSRQRLAGPRAQADGHKGGSDAATAKEQQLAAQRAERAAARKREQVIYQFAAVAATTLITATAGFATYYRIVWHLSNGDAFPYLELAATLALCAGAAFGMEMYARWVHKDMWHDNPIGWILHKSHHEPRTGPFEANDIYALVNALPAMGLCLYGFLRPDVWGGVCFGAGLGITLFGISYMFVHDGLVHRRFPVGPIAELPAMKRIVLAHQLHHSEKYGGVPFGMFLGPQELEAVGAGPELDRMVAELEASKAKKQATAAARR